MMTDDHKSDVRQACNDIIEFVRRMEISINQNNAPKDAAHWNRHIRAKLDVIEELCVASAKR
jgi:hypothetical protein